MDGRQFVEAHQREALLVIESILGEHAKRAYWATVGRTTPDSIQWKIKAFAGIECISNEDGRRDEALRALEDQTPVLRESLIRRAKDHWDENRGKPKHHYFCRVARGELNLASRELIEGDLTACLYEEDSPRELAPAIPGDAVTVLMLIADSSQQRASHIEPIIGAVTVCFQKDQREIYAFLPRVRAAVGEVIRQHGAAITPWVRMPDELGSYEEALWNVLLVMPTAPEVPFARDGTAHNFDAKMLQIPDWKTFLDALRAVAERITHPIDPTGDAEHNLVRPWQLMKHLLSTRTVYRWKPNSGTIVNIPDLYRAGWDSFGVLPEKRMPTAAKEPLLQILLGTADAKITCEGDGRPSKALAPKVPAPCALPLRFFAPLAEFVHRLRTSQRVNLGAGRLFLSLHGIRGAQFSPEEFTWESGKSGDFIPLRWAPAGVKERCHWSYDLDIVADPPAGHRIWEFGFIGRAGSKAMNFGNEGETDPLDALQRLLGCGLPKFKDMHVLSPPALDDLLTLERDSPLIRPEYPDLVSCREITVMGGQCGIRLSWIGSADWY
jgi:hypothetical protein